jgi:hypothetical protein
MAKDESAGAIRRIRHWLFRRRVLFAGKELKRGDRENAIDDSQLLEGRR